MGDELEYTVQLESPHLGPVFAHDVEENFNYLNLNGKSYAHGEGILPTIRTRVLKLVFRVPGSYGVHVDDFHPYVGSGRTRIDYIVASELARIKCEKESFGGDVEITCTIDSPLLLHEYGIAWNPPSCPIANITK